MNEWAWSIGGKILTGENRRTVRKTCSSATLSATNPTQSGLRQRGPSCCEADWAVARHRTVFLVRVYKCTLCRNTLFRLQYLKYWKLLTVVSAFTNSLNYIYSLNYEHYTHPLYITVYSSIFTTVLYKLLFIGCIIAVLWRVLWANLCVTPWAASKCGQLVNLVFVVLLKVDVFTVRLSY